jgi:hypothetical protein
MASMAEPSLTILGVYRPQISPETWQEQWQITADDQETHEHFADLVLIEGVVEHLTEPFDLDSFGQMRLAFLNDPMRFMCGYDEGLLAADGETLIDRGMDCIHGSGALRFAVYLHQYDSDRPLKWQHGEVTCPPVTDAPVRLMMLMPYNVY